MFRKIFVVVLILVGGVLYCFIPLVHAMKSVGAKRNAPQQPPPPLAPAAAPPLPPAAPPLPEEAARNWAGIEPDPEISKDAMQRREREASARLEAVPRAALARLRPRCPQPSLLPRRYLPPKPVVFIPEIDLGHMSFEERYDYADQQRERGERLQAESDQAWLDSLPPDLKELWVHMTPAMRMHELARNEDKDRMRFEQMSPAMQERQRQQDEEDLRRWERESRWKKMSPAEQERALWAQLTPAEQERARQLQPPRSTTEALVRQDVIYEVFKLRGGKPDWNGRTYSYPEAYQTRLDVLRPYLRDGIHRNLAEEEAFRFQQYWEDRAEDATINR